MVRNIVSFSGLKKIKNKIKDANCNIILKRRCSILVAQLFDYFKGQYPPGLSSELNKQNIRF